MKRSFCVVAVGVLSLGLARSAFPDEVYPALRTITGIVAVRESSYKWNPQIQAAYHPGIGSPPNPSRPDPPTEAINTLPVGETLTTSRGRTVRSFPGIEATGWVPPDPNIAVGPNHIVEVVNSDIAWFDKATGVKQFQVSMAPIPGAPEGFFESVGATDFVFDPKCFFDPVSNRFFVVALEAEFGAQISKALIAVSDDNNPNGNWNKYRFEAKLTVSGTPTWLDYPGFGCNKDAVVVTGNQFGFGSGFFGVQAIVIPKAPLLAGAPASQSQILIENAFTVQVARTPDPNLGVIYMAGQANTTNALRLYAVTGSPASPSVVSTLVTVPTWFFPTANAVSTQGRQLDSLDGRIVDANWLSGKLVAVHTVRAGQSDNRNVMRWYEFNTGNWPSSGSPTLSQSGNVSGGAGEHYNMGGIAINAAGDIVLTFTRSSASITADHMIAARTMTDPPGTMGAPILVQSSLGAAYGLPGFNRWGDYFSVEVDPVDGTTFYSVGMIGKANGDWTTIVNQHTVSTIIPGTTVDVQPTAASIYVDALSEPQQQGANLVGGATEMSLADGQFATVDSVTAPGFGEIAATELSFFVDTGGGTVLDLRIRAKVAATVTVTGMLWAYDWSRNRYVQLRSFRVSPTSNSILDLRLAKPFGKWMGPGGQVKVVFRGLAPVRRNTNTNPVPFTARIDMVNVRARIQ